MIAKQLFAAGKVQEAIAALGAHLRDHPTDSVQRTFLFELLCFAGQYDRAEKQLGVLAHTAMVALPDEMTVEERAEIGPDALQGILVARDPVSNREVWRQQLGFYSGGGTLSTQGNLLFQGDMQGHFTAYAADTGEQLWSRSVQSGVMAGPIS